MNGVKQRMTTDDMFSGRREKIIEKSGVRQVFTPSQPVAILDLLLGRDLQINRLVEILNTPGQHAMLFGDRGVGKSSLARCVCAILKLHKFINEKNLTYKICSSEDTFETIVAGSLRKIGFDVSAIENTSISKQKIGAKITALFASADAESAKENSTKRKLSWNVSSIAELLSKTDGLLVIDEADSIANNLDKKKVAELVKLLSDTGSKFKVMIVGIASTGSELIAGHPSVGRCLGQVKLERLANPELWKIITKGLEQLKGGVRLDFDSDVINSIVNLSNGYPYFTHLLALKCAEEAIVSNQYSVRKSDLITATTIAAEAAEGVLTQTYQEATRSSSTNGHLYSTILLAAARLSSHEFKATELRQEISKLIGRDIPHSQLKNYFKTLISDKETTILRRVGRGVYRFNDPRFPSFIKIKHSDI